MMLSSFYLIGGGDCLKLLALSSKNLTASVWLMRFVWVYKKSSRVGGFAFSPNRCSAKSLSESTRIYGNVLKLFYLCLLKLDTRPVYF
jgi:hypothetical protein